LPKRGTAEGVDGTAMVTVPMISVELVVRRSGCTAAAYAGRQS